MYSRMDMWSIEHRMFLLRNFKRIKTCGDHFNFSYSYSSFFSGFVITIWLLRMSRGQILSVYCDLFKSIVHLD